jgi:hypothetical protein
MSIIFLGLLSFIISPLSAAEIQCVTKGVIQEKDTKEKHERVPLLQHSSWIHKVNEFPLDIRKIICKNVKMLICIENLNIDKQSFLDADKKYGNNWNKVKSSSLLWYYHAGQHYMAENKLLTVGSKRLNIHDVLQLSADQRDLMIRASKSDSSPISYWDYLKLEKIPAHITEGMTVIFNEPAFFEEVKCLPIGSLEEKSCSRGSFTNGVLCGAGSLVSGVLVCALGGCQWVPTGMIVLGFNVVGPLSSTIFLCCCAGRKTKDFKSIEKTS